MMIVKRGMVFVEEGGNSVEGNSVEGNFVEGNFVLCPCSSAFNSLLLWFCLFLFLLVVFSYQPIRVKVFPWFPEVVAHGIALPLN